MRTASILFLALLATTAHAQERIPGTDLVLITYGKVADPWAEKGTMYARIAAKSKTSGNTIIDDVQVRCKSKTFRYEEEGWTPTSTNNGSEQLREHICGWKTGHFW